MNPVIRKLGVGAPDAGTVDCPMASDAVATNIAAASARASKPLIAASPHPVYRLPTCIHPPPDAGTVSAGPATASRVLHPPTSMAAKEDCRFSNRCGERPLAKRDAYSELGREDELTRWRTTLREP